MNHHRAILIGSGCRVVLTAGVSADHIHVEIAPVLAHAEVTSFNSLQREVYCQRRDLLRLVKYLESGFRESGKTFVSPELELWVEVKSPNDDRSAATLSVQICIGQSEDRTSVYAGVEFFVEKESVDRFLAELRGFFS